MIKICLYCNKRFKTNKIKRKFCCHLCYSNSNINKKRNYNMLGINNPHWKGGKPKCIDCEKQLKNYNAKRCRSCALKLRNKIYGHPCKGKLGEKHPCWKGGKVIRKCIQCQKEFYIFSSKLKYQPNNFCSRKCFEKWRSKNLIPWSKGKKFPTEYRKKISQSRLGKYKHSLNPNWRGGITPIAFLLRQLEENKQWIKKIFQRDNYACQECGDNKGGNLNAHHIKPFSYIFQEFLYQYSQFSPIEDKETLVRLAITYEPFWDINNGITLCEKCHNKTKIKI